MFKNIFVICNKIHGRAFHSCRSIGALKLAPTKTDTLDSVILLSNSQPKVNPRVYYSSTLEKSPIMATDGVISLLDHDVIGFDVDHTFAKYDMMHLYSTIHDNLVNFLIEQRGWEESLREPFSKHNSFCTRGIVLDIKKGNFLKVRSDGYITRASHGTQFLSDEKITEAYGAERKWEHAATFIEKVDNIPNRLTGEREFMIFDNFYDCIGMPAMGRMIDIMDAKIAKHGREMLDDYTFLYRDLMAGYTDLYMFTAFKDDTGGFFPAFKRETGKFIFPCDASVIEWLKELKREGKVLFLMTSSYVDFAKCTLDYIFGEDWQDLFDLTITFARKPSFYTDNHKFLTTDLQGSKQTSVDVIESGQVYSQGNLSDLMEYFKRTTGKESPKVLYCGDSLRSDIASSKRHAGWSTLMLLEEMYGDNVPAPSNDDTTNGNGKEAPVSKKSKLNITSSDCECLSAEQWGSFFTEDGKKEIKDGRREMNTMWMHCVGKYADIAVPSIEYIASLPIRRSYEVFSENDPLAGFYPDLPHALKSS